MPYDTNNVFAKILRKEIPCTFLYEDAHTVAFKDINPKAKVHILIIPKGQYASFTEFSTQANAEEMVSFIKAIGHLIHENNLAEKGYRLITNCNAHGRQEVPHLHIHLLGGEDIGPMTCKKETPSF